jgi:hypothetical protein
MQKGGGKEEIDELGERMTSRRSASPEVIGGLQMGVVVLRGRAGEDKARTGQRVLSPTKPLKNW